jgi:hypothetical protein
MPDKPAVTIEDANGGSHEEKYEGELRQRFAGSWLRKAGDVRVIGTVRAFVAARRDG